MLAQALVWAIFIGIALYQESCVMIINDELLRVETKYLHAGYTRQKQTRVLCSESDEENQK